MKSLKKSLLVVSTLLIAGCDQSATSVFKKEPIYGQNIQYTQVVKIMEDKEVKAVLNVTYLNSSNPKVWDNGKQNFLVGIYTTNEDKNDYPLTMNDNPVKKIKAIDKNDKIYKNIAFRNTWAKYQILTFDDVDEKTLTIKYDYDYNSNTNLTFTKE